MSGQPGEPPAAPPAADAPDALRLKVSFAQCASHAMHSAYEQQTSCKASRHCSAHAWHICISCALPQPNLKGFLTGCRAAECLHIGAMPHCASYKSYAAMQSAWAVTDGGQKAAWTTCLWTENRASSAHMTGVKMTPEGIMLWNVQDWAKLWNPDLWFPAKLKSEAKGSDPSPAPSKAPSLSLPSDLDAAGPSSLYAEAAALQEPNHR